MPGIPRRFPGTSRLACAKRSPTPGGADPRSPAERQDDARPDASANPAATATVVRRRAVRRRPRATRSASWRACRRSPSSTRSSGSRSSSPRSRSPSTGAGPPAASSSPARPTSCSCRARRLPRRAHGHPAAPSARAVRDRRARGRASSTRCSAAASGPAIAERLGTELAERIAAGGYPAALARRAPGRRRAWYRDYVETQIQRDVRDLTRIRSLDALPKLLALAAAQTARLINVADLAAPFELTRQTIHDYVTLLERVFLLERLPPWHTNRLSRLVKRPKLHMGDTGVACALLGLDAAASTATGRSSGAARDVRAPGTAAPGELATEPSASSTSAIATTSKWTSCWSGDAAVAGVEVKAAATVRSRLPGPSQAPGRRGQPLRRWRRPLRRQRRPLRDACSRFPCAGSGKRGLRLALAPRRESPGRLVMLAGNQRSRARRPGDPASLRSNGPRLPDLEQLRNPLASALHRPRARSGPLRIFRQGLRRSTLEQELDHLELTELGRLRMTTPHVL